MSGAISVGALIGLLLSSATARAVPSDPGAPAPAPAVSPQAPTPDRKEIDEFTYNMGLVEVLFPDLRLQAPSPLGSGINSLILSWPVHVVGVTTLEWPSRAGTSLFVEPAISMNDGALRGLAGVRAFAVYSRFFGAAAEGGGVVGLDGSGWFVGGGPAIGWRGILALVARRYFVPSDERWDFTFDLSVPDLTLIDIIRIGAKGLEVKGKANGSTQTAHTEPVQYSCPSMPPENAAAVTYELTLDDYRALQAHVCRPIQRPPLYHHVLVALASIAMVILALSFLPSPRSFFVGFFGALLLIVGCSRLVTRRARAVTDPEPNRSILCHQEYSFTDEGLRHRTPHWDGVTRWSGIVRVDETEQHLFLMIDRAAGHTIPKRAFASSADAASFAERVRARLAGR